MYGKKTGGRKKGSRNRKTIAREAVEIAPGVEQAIGEGAFPGDAHTFLMAVYKDPKQTLVMRIDAAKAAIGYEKPKLTSLDANIDATVGNYTAIPVEQRDSDSLESPTGPAAGSHSPGHG